MTPKAIFDLSPETYVWLVVFVSADGVDWLGMVLREADGQTRIKIRYCEDDSKKIWVYGVKDDSPESIADACADLRKVGNDLRDQWTDIEKTHAAQSGEPVVIPTHTVLEVNDNGTKAAELLLKQPWSHVQTNSQGGAA